MFPGAVLSAASWQVLQLLGGIIVGRTLQHSSALYGVFGIVLGLLAWLYLQAQITLYAAEVCTVRSWRLCHAACGRRRPRRTCAPTSTTAGPTASCHLPVTEDGR